MEVRPARKVVAHQSAAGQSERASTHVRETIAAVLPSGARVRTPGEASDEALRLSRAYRSNLTALALVALFTGGFFVYSTQSLAALRRRREFAMLHAIGVTRARAVATPARGQCAHRSIVARCSESLSGVAIAAIGLECARRGSRRRLFSRPVHGSGRACWRDRSRSSCLAHWLPSWVHCGLRSNPHESPRRAH